MVATEIYLYVFSLRFKIRYNLKCFILHPIGAAASKKFNSYRFVKFDKLV